MQQIENNKCLQKLTLWKYLMISQTNGEIIIKLETNKKKINKNKLWNIFLFLKSIKILLKKNKKIPLKKNIFKNIRNLKQ